ncbi:MAG: alpha-glucosidase C-terminal domain-containing protein, partial [Bacteroidota bacterium]
LNFDNPAVQDEVFKILDYWANMGIDGFRLDAIPYLFEREGTNCENLPETHVFLKKLRTHMDTHHEGLLFLAEANMWPEDSASYFGDGDECHMNYHFPLMPRMYMSLKMEDRHPITDIFEQTPEIPPNCQWAMFLRNHDELTLEMVTDEERDYMRKNYAADPKARINLGIRRRLAPLLDNDRNKIELLNVLLFSFPGTPVLYYGDEIGMGDNYYLGDRDGVRTPMQWNANQNAGFSEANPQSLYLPVIIDPEYDYKYINVARQQRNTNSLLWWTKRIIATRQRYQAFGRGSMEFLAPSNGKILAFIRKYEEETILVVVNLSRFVEGVHLDLQDYQNYTPIEIFGDSEFPNINNEPYFLTLSPHGYYWFELKALETQQLTEKQLQSPQIQAVNLSQVIQEKALTTKVLPQFFRKVEWFGNKERSIENVELMDKVLFKEEDKEYAIAIVKVNFRTGLPELFQLPITFQEVSDLEDVWLKDEVIGVADIQGKGVLLDAFYDDDFRLAVLNKIDDLNNNKSLHYASWESISEVTESSIRRSTGQYISIEYKEGYFVKFYRRIDVQPNPDFEVNYWLTQEKDFEHVPKLIGGIFYRNKKGLNTSLATIQPLIPHQGYGWDYVNDHLKRVVESVSVNPENKKMPSERISMFDGALKYEDWASIFQSSNLQSFLERIQSIAERTAQMHIALTNSTPLGDESFKPELFSLHYQRSLYSALKALVRVTLKTLKSSLDQLSEENQKKGEKVLNAEALMSNYFKRIYIHKFSASKIRIHGNFHLEQIMMVGDDIQIDDFDGTYDRPFSERKLRKSPLMDVVTLLRSIHYAKESIKQQNQEVKDIDFLLHYWYEGVSGYFLKAYQDEIEKAKIAEFIPEDEGDFRILMEVFMLERALKELFYELNYRPEMAIIPIEGILDLLDL